MSIGDALAAARREAGLTITQVSQRTCIRETIVRGIERGDYSACGGDFYARGHIRSIARAVGADPEELIREYDATQAPPQPISAADVFQPFTPVKMKERRRTHWGVVLVIGVLAVLGVAGFSYWHSNSTPKPKADSHKVHASTSPGTKTVTHHRAAPPKGIRLRLVATAGSVTWAEVTTRNGTVVFQGDLADGASKRWSQPSGPVTISLGNPGGAKVYLNGKRVTTEVTQPVTLSCTKTKCTVTAVG